MKHYPILLLLLLCSLQATAQIPTPDFRYYSSCPTSFSQVYKCNGWYQPTSGTSDYYNACADSLYVGVPKNYLGYQTSAKNTYMGLITYEKGGGDYKEYIGTDFPALTVGQTYQMSITVSLADNSHYATDGLGVFFTTYPIHETTYVTLPVTPQVDYSNFGTIKDSIHWVKMTKSFVADSAYTHLTIGAFKSDVTLHIDTVSGSLPYSYYYISQIGVSDSTRHLPTDSLTAPGYDTTTEIIGDSTTTIIVPDTTTQINPDTTKQTFPTGFTPNGNGLNDIFRIITNQGAILQDYSLSVFNRWGERVFFTTDQADGWDGTYKGLPADVGVYFYLAHFTINGKEKLLKGDVTLVR